MQAAAGSAPVSAMPVSALAAWPGCSVMSVSGTNGLRLAGAPMTLPRWPVTNDTPGYPYSVHGDAETLVSTMTR